MFELSLYKLIINCY